MLYQANIELEQYLEEVKKLIKNQRSISCKMFLSLNYQPNSFPDSQNLKILHDFIKTGKLFHLLLRVSFSQQKPVEFVLFNFLLFIHFQMQTKICQPFYKTFPLFVCAPMVQQSELSFRLLCRKYGCNLAYTPMLNSKMMISQKNYKSYYFQTNQFDKPLVAQLCGNDPQVMLKAAQMLQEQIDAIDINLGCPQAIAKKGHYGAYLLNQPQLISNIVQTLSNNLSIPVFCKMRILADQQKTIQLAILIEKSGCRLLTVHGRTKQMNKERVGQCNWDIIQKIKKQLSIPILANGDYQFKDVQRCLEETKVDGVMSAEALLQNPALFSQQQVEMEILAKQYLNLAKQCQTKGSIIKSHLFKMLHAGLKTNIDLRERLSVSKTYAEFEQIVDELNERKKQLPEEEKGWYFRYRQKEKL